ncbi:MAG TPA: caspase family protein [Reyranella sp.]|nr:caspase family protein [Reyranella sp.]
MGRKGIGRRGAVIGAAGLLTAPGLLRAQGQFGVALVIGNSKYQWEAQLPNVRRDAPDIAKSFQAMGLKTELLQDVGREAMSAAITRFGSASAGANLAALYFAGHGASWDKDTYLVPIDADLSSPSTVKSLVPVPSIEAAMRAASHRLLVFDNCRNNPADGWRQLAAERTAATNQDQQRADAADANPNSLTLFSTAPGHAALDGPPGENSPFAAALLRQFATPSVDLQALAAKVRREVLIATAGRQVVWDSNTYRDPFVLGGRGKSAAPTGPAGWGADPSRIIELPNAYAFARKNGLPLPEGLIAHRPAGNSSNFQKVGSFEFVAQTINGPSPFLFIVMSVDEQGSAQMITSVQNEMGRIWRFTTGTVAGSRLTFTANYGRPDRLIDWSDANSGSVGSLVGDNYQKATGRNLVKSIRFTRLDG